MRLEVHILCMVLVMELMTGDWGKLTWRKLDCINTTSMLAQQSALHNTLCSCCPTRWSDSVACKHLTLYFHTFVRHLTTIRSVVWWAARCNDTGNGTCAGRGSGWWHERHITSTSTLCACCAHSFRLTVSDVSLPVAYTSCPGPGRVLLNCCATPVYNNLSFTDICRLK